MAADERQKTPIKTDVLSAFIGVHRRPISFSGIFEHPLALGEYYFYSLLTRAALIGAHLLPVHPRTRLPAGGLAHRDGVEDALIHWQYFIDRGIGFHGEQVAQAGSRGIVEIQRPHPQQPEDG